MSLRSVRPVTWVRWAAGVALLGVAAALLVRAGQGAVAFMIFVPLPVMILGIGAVQRREVATLTAQGWDRRRAQKRVQRNSKPWFALVFAVFACWFIAGPAVARAFGGGAMWTLWGSGSYGWVFLWQAAFMAWFAVASGVLVGEGPHCKRCGYPVISATEDLCPECGSVLVPSTTREGRLVRPAWTLVLAIAATIAAAGMLLVGGLGGGLTRVWIGAAPNSMVVTLATGQDQQGAMTAWSELGTRTLDAASNRALVNGILTRWEADGRLPLLTGGAMAALVQQELAAGRLDEATIDRLIALARSMPTDPFGNVLLAPLQRMALTAEQSDQLAAAVFPPPGTLQWWMGPSADWLAEWFAAGHAAPALEEAYLAELRAASMDKRSFAATKVAARIASLTQTPRVYDAMVEIVVDATARKDGSTTLFQARGLLLEALLSGRLSEPQSSALLLHLGGSSMFSRLSFEGISDEERVWLRDALVRALAVSPTVFVERQPTCWAWLQREWKAGRLTEEQAGLMEAAVEVVGESKNRGGL